MPICGNCKQHHNTVQDIRDCYAKGKDVTQNQPQRVEPEWPASEPQIRYVLGLQEERILPDNWTVYSEDDLKHMERDDVSSAIVMLKSMARKDKDARASDVPAGRYALLREFGTNNNPDSAWSFYEVNKPTEGKWKGYTFISLLIGSPGDYRRIKLNAMTRNVVLADIARNPRQASIDYGKQSGVCGVCHSPLTNKESLKRGIGPVCAAKMEW